jgi:hypothetical protein
VAGAPLRRPKEGASRAGKLGFQASYGIFDDIVFGPGSTLAAGWYWKEEILKEESREDAEVRLEMRMGNGGLRHWPGRDLMRFILVL